VRLKLVAKSGVTKLIEEITTILLADFDAKTRFELRASPGRGRIREGDTYPLLLAVCTRNGRGRAQIGQGSLNPRVSPRSIHKRHAQNEINDRLHDARPTDASQMAVVPPGEYHEQQLKRLKRWEHCSKYSGWPTIVRNRAAGMRVLRSRRSNFRTLRAHCRQ
jgi:hypothetical protein